MSRALLVVPPFMKYSAGPLLGPALLKAKALQRGHVCSVLDMNAHFIRLHGPERNVYRGNFVGDHDKPRDPSCQSLSDVEGILLNQILSCQNRLGRDISNEEAIRRVRFGFLQHDEVEHTATELSKSSLGSWARKLLESHQEEPPDLFGVSLLHAGQVIPATAISMIARELWPDTLVVWGGPHISGIGEAIRNDVEDRKFAADLFVSGHAEQTFNGILDHLSLSKSMIRPSGFEEGKRGKSVVPLFKDLDLYDEPPVLPVQSTIGCAYGRCKFCTYPVMEPTPTKLDLCIVESVVESAHEIGAFVAFKDSLVTALRLQEIGESISGRVKWSACTKLNEKLNRNLLIRLESNGLKTLEVGLESLLLETQRKVAKVHQPDLFESFIHDVSKVPNLSIVVNYMTGFPWEFEDQALEKLELAKDVLFEHLGTRGKLEHNQFELERLSPMATDPERYSIDKASLKFWPWASVVEFERMSL